MDRTLLRPLAYLSDAENERGRLPIALIVPENVAKADVLSTVLRLTPKMAEVLRRVQLVKKSALINRSSGQHSTDRLVQVLKTSGFSMENGLDIFIKNRGDWADPTLQNDVRLLMSITENLVYDATEKLDTTIETIRLFRVQA